MYGTTVAHRLGIIDESQSNFVAYGSGFRSRYSNDGNSWFNSNTIVTNNWGDVAFGNGVYVMPGISSSNVTYSFDGKTWFISPTMPTGVWNSIAFGNGKFVTVSATGALYSTDGINWTSIPGVTGFKVNFGNGNFMIIIGGGTGQTSIKTSPDGINWTTRTVPSGNWTVGGAANGVYLIASGGDADIVADPGLRSTDLINWTTTTMPDTGGTPTSYNSIAFGNSTFVATALATGSVAYSLNNGSTWIATTHPAINFAVEVIFALNKFWLITSVGNLATSTDGITWLSAGSAGTGDNTRAITYGQ